ncbi:hypothetical protein CAMRE0001_0399 [Campylobacter rectus RM3267]|uniref:Uncharacterized protein n=1 Tax=Campylobacter rectus RM3267 TaxID=553218 RepID=B9D2G6_CAMRE|nr:hypothetical protein CAMRE0001_0399 [Campylobacter rectus RM3267]
MLHCVQVKFGANELRIQIYVFAMRISETQICKFYFKFERKTIRRSIFSLDEAETTEARERTSRP